MANIKSAAKRALQNEKRRVRNSSVITGLKTAQKKLQSAVAAGNPEATQAEARAYSSALDKAAKRGIIHKNAADRRKSTLARSLAPAAH